MSGSVVAFVMRHVDGLTNTQRETGRKGGRERENGMTLNTFRHLIRHQGYTLYPRPGRDLLFFRSGSRFAVGLMGRNLSMMGSLCGWAWPWGCLSEFQSPLAPWQRAAGSFEIKGSYRHLLSSFTPSSPDSNPQPPSCPLQPLS